MSRRPFNRKGAPAAVARLRPYAAVIAWGSVAALLILAGLAIRMTRADRGARAAGAGAPAAGGSIPIPPPPPEADPWSTNPAPLTVPADAAPRTEMDPQGMERVLALQEQVRLLREYAALHGPDDPFSLTEEQIEEFRKRGDSVIW